MRALLLCLLSPACPVVQVRAWLLYLLTQACPVVQVRHQGSVPLPLLVACLIAAMVVVYATHQASLLKPKGAARAKGRSTDRVD